MNRYIKGALTLNKLPLSVAIISLNEERIIGKMLEQVSKIASEIIIVDSGSTDNTIKIAKEFGATIYQEEWKGFVEQKNSALKKCDQDWILCLDCDEVPDGQMLIEIASKIKMGKPSAYYLNRKTVYLGKELNYAWQPDWNLRLVHSKFKPIWKGKNPHDKLYCDIKGENLKGSLLHFSYTGIKNHFLKMVHYSKISAESYDLAGKKFKKRNLILNPVIAFVRQYIFRNAWKDGIRGLIVALSTFISTFLKYAQLWEIQKDKY